MVGRFINSLTPKGDNITLESHIKVMRLKIMTTDQRSS